MAVETELKLRIAPEDMERLKRHPMLKKLSLGRATTLVLRNIYYDTPDLILHGHEMALRLRQAGDKWLQTLKGGGGVEAGLHSRNEWETEVAGEALDFRALKAAGGKLPAGVVKRLQPVFSTDFSRTVRELRYQGAVIELCMDSGEIRAGEKRRPISELELELRSGEPRHLFDVALEFLDIVPLEVESASKAEYGYRLYSGNVPSVAKAAFPALDKGQGTASALRAMVASCLWHVQANIPGAIGNLNEEYLHQVRVGLRRLRVVLAIANSYLSNSELEALRAETGELGEKLGVARDWDVFVTQTLPAVRKQFPRHAGLRNLALASQHRREACRAEMRANLGSRDLQRLILRLGGWLQGDYWRADGGDAAPLARFAAKVLRKRSKQVMRHGKHVSSGEAPELHALRIACKKLRYSGEMLGTLYKVIARKRYLAAMSALQDALGMLNDITTARRLLAEASIADERATLDLVLGRLRDDEVKRLAELGKAWKRFASQNPFWEA